MRKLNLAQEENLEPIDPNAIHEANQAIAEADSGVAEAQLQITEIGAAIDSAEDAKQTVEVAADGMEATLDNGGMDENGVKVLQQSLEHMLSRLGYQSATMRYAHESFSAKKDNIAATKLAVEDLRETAKKIWEKIKAAFRKLIEWIKNLFNSKEKKFEAISKKAGAMATAAKAEAKNGGKAESTAVPKEKTVKVEYPLVFTHSNGSPFSEKEIRDLIEHSAVDYAKNLANSVSQFSNLNKLINTGISSLSAGNTRAQNEFIEHVMDFYQGIVSAQLKSCDSHKVVVINETKLHECLLFTHAAIQAKVLLPDPDNFKQLDIEQEGDMGRIISRMAESLNQTAYQRHVVTDTKATGDRMSFETGIAMLDAVCKQADGVAKLYKTSNEGFKIVDRTIDKLESKAMETGNNDQFYLAVATMLRVLVRWVTQMNTFYSHVMQDIFSGFLQLANE